MSVELFFKLKEIDSLTKMRSSALKAKNEQDERISKLSERQNEKISQTATLKQELIQLKDKLSQIEQKLKIAGEQKQRLMDMGGDEKKIQDFSTQMSTLEDEGMILMEREEEVEREINDVKTFLTGIEKTKNEIQLEVNEVSTKLNQDIANSELRIKLLTEELPDSFRNNLHKITAKNLAHGPFTRIENGSCYFCRFKISRMDESEIDMQQALKNCPQCSRIFLPYGS